LSLVNWFSGNLSFSWATHLSMNEENALTCCLITYISYNFVFTGNGRCFYLCSQDLPESPTIFTQIFSSGMHSVVLQTYQHHFPNRLFLFIILVLFEYKHTCSYQHFLFSYFIFSRYMKYSVGLFNVVPYKDFWMYEIFHEYRNNTSIMNRNKRFGKWCW
jgi:hypothetical protein